jgi:serine phosphatase RsbU (regulator of sigma subunit)
VVKPVPGYLKLRAVEPAVAPPDVEFLPGLEPLCLAFSQATGWPLAFGAGAASVDQIDILWSAPVNPGVGASPGHLRIELGQPKNVAQLAARVPLEDAESLAAAIASLLRQNFTLRDSLWKREAELAAGVPVAARPDEPQHLASRLETALKSGAQLLGCDAAALYTLDEATSQLKLRSSWQLPFDRLEQPARPLATALADLEALLGHAVALEATSALRPWNVPEQCEAALCVPVSSPTMPLGTLWFFSHSPRQFTTEQTNLAEIIAGRLAAELDRAVLLHERVQSIGLQQDLDQTGRTQQAALSLPPPEVDGYDIAGWSCQAQTIGGAFHVWRSLPDERIALAVADACDGGIAGAMAAAALRATLYRLLDSGRDPEDVLADLQQSIVELAAGDQWAGLALAYLSLTSGEVSLVAAGRPSTLWITEDSVESLVRPSLPLGLADLAGEAEMRRFQIQPQRLCLDAGDALVLFSRGFVETADEHGRPLDEAALAQSLLAARTRSAAEILETLCDRQEAHALTPNRFDRSVVVVKRLATRRQLKMTS